MVRLSLSIFTCYVAVATANKVHITSLVAENGTSNFECWALQPGLSVIHQSGLNGVEVLPLGALQNATYTVWPAGFKGGPHNDPSPQYFVAVNGLLHITIPNSAQEAFLLSGKNGLAFVADTTNLSPKGHITSNPTKEDTITLQIPTADGLIPKHRVLHKGVCTGDE
ncbi:hypothetical protein F5884DRAFT_685354 [Xylogone sp. PMI_703]|nr:hypothetical protein F5884DRAFT_685354 [Xylogone sp. PMI_703]